MKLKLPSLKANGRNTWTDFCSAFQNHQSTRPFEIALSLLSMNHEQAMRRRRIRLDLPRNIQMFMMTSLRSDPTGANRHQDCDIVDTIENSTEEYFRRTFRVSRNVFTAILNELHPFLQYGSSRNKRQNISAELKLGIALYYMAHGGCGRHLRSASGLTASTARKYVYQVSKLICEKLAHKHMGDALLKERDYIQNCRARFQARNGFPNVVGCIDGTHIPYKPNFGEFEADYKNYKQRRAAAPPAPARARPSPPPPAGWRPRIPRPRLDLSFVHCICEQLSYVC